ncbi:MAG: efflux RND transporter periplasmic adaptor subunit [Gammaproteobacteria bacterium]|nr:efflux RND transporter periplasmic adaptor subunit [Gammaproteobacteria bacterium]
MNRLTTVMLVLLLPAAAAAQQQDGRHECLMEPAVEVSLSSPVAGVIESISVHRGSPVEEGQVLAKLEAAAEQAAVDLARAKLEFGQRKVARTKELYSENFTSEYSVDEAVTEARLATVELEQAQTILARKTIRSPITGLVVDKNADVGEFVDDDEILTLVKLDPLYIEVVVPVDQLDSISTGMQATVYPQQPVGGEYKAEVVTVDQVVDAASGTFGVRLALPNRDGGLPAGLRCMVAFPDS